jgi:hypothetical protein
MTGVLAARVRELVDMGWNVRSQTETTAVLEARKPFNWLLFALLLFFLFVALIYLAYWFMVSRASVFLSVENGKLVESGDLAYIEQQEKAREKAIAKAQEVRERGFWRVMWPSILAWVAMIALWFFLIWWIISL